MNENTRSERMVGSRWLLARLAVALTLLVGTRAFAVVTVKVATDSGSPGGAVHLTLSVSREADEGQLASLNADVIFDTTQLDLVGRCGNDAMCRVSTDCVEEDDYCRFYPSVCEKDPRLTEQNIQVLPPDFQNVQPGQRRVRFAVVATRLPVPTFSDGNLITCTFQVPATATAGQIALTADRVQVADNSIPSRALPSRVVIEAGSITPGGGTPTASATRSGTPPTATPTIGSPTATATSRTPATATATTAGAGGTPTPTATQTGQGCPAPRPAPAGPALYVEDLNLTTAGAASFSVKLASGTAQVAGTQNDIAFGASVAIQHKANGKPDCAVNPAIDKTATSFAFRPPGCSGDACNAIRGLVLSTDNVDVIPDGAVLYTCNIVVTASGTEAVSGVILSTPDGERVDGATGRDGSICVGPAAPSPTPTTVGGATPTRTPSAVLTPPTGVPTATRSSTPRATPTNTSGGNVGGGGGGGGCNCHIDAEGRPQGGASVLWLMAPAALLFWRRRPRG